MLTLEQWLSVATSGLCDSAAARVRAEISEHCLSAVETAGTAGMDPLEAEGRAVAALGDAKTANRQYRRVLLTAGEARLLSGLTVVPHLIGILLLAMTAIFAIWVRSSWLNYVIAATVIEAALVATPVSSIRAGWAVRILRWGNLTVFYTIWFAKALGFSAVPAVLIPVMALGAVHREYKLAVIRRKLPLEQWPRRLRV